MHLETSRFGSIEFHDDAVITFTQPIIGFQEFRRFVLLPGPSASLKWLQSTEAGDLAFILMDPRAVMPDYRVDLGKVELAELAVQSAAELDVYALVVVPEDKTKVRTNLKAPILISRKHRLGKQTILERSQYPIQYYLSHGKGQAQSLQEVSNAGTHP